MICDDFLDDLQWFLVIVMTCMNCPCMSGGR